MAVQVPQHVYDMIAEQQVYWANRAAQEIQNRDTAEANRVEFEANATHFGDIMADLEVTS
jgi:hypothetical protein